MIEFKENVKEVLPYNREHYIDFLTDDVEVPSTIWYGVSFQFQTAMKPIDFIKFIDVYEPWFRNLILNLDNGSNWIVNHEYDTKWFPNDEETLQSLRTLFKQYNISNEFKGALIFKKDDLLKFSKDLISYPYSVFAKKSSLYTDLDISHSKIPLVIHISGHLNIDLLSTDLKLLKKVVKENHSESLDLKEYTGTSLT